MTLAKRISAIRNDPKQVRFFAAVTAAIAVTLFIYRDALYHIVKRYNELPELSHGYFIPLIAGWLAWSNRDAVLNSIGPPSMAGLYLAIVSAILLLLGPITFAFIIQDTGFIVAVMALVAGFGGLSLLRVLAVPIAFLIVAIPPPYWAIQTLSWNFQGMSSKLGVAMIQMMNIPVHLSGNIIDLGVTQLEVAEACSGLRYLFPFMTLGILVAYLFKAPMWQRIIVFLSTIPITIAMNSLRIAITAALVQAYGPSHTEGFLHFFEGWVVFLLCLVLLVGVVALFCLVVPPRRHVLDALGVPEVKSRTPKKGLAGRLENPLVPGLIAGLFVLTWIGTSIVTIDKLIVPERKTFAEFVYEFPEWTSTIEPIDSEIAEVLAADDSIVVNFVNEDKDLFNVYMAYLTARRDGSTWHSPRQCIPGGGWQITALDIIPASNKPGELPFAHNRMLIEFGEQRQIVYYWYDQRGREIADEYVMKATVIYDTVTRRRADGALVRIMMPVPVNGDLAKAESTLKQMTLKVKAELPAYIPE